MRSVLQYAKHAWVPTADIKIQLPLHHLFFTALDTDKHRHFQKVEYLLSEYEADASCLIYPAKLHGYQTDKQIMTAVDSSRIFLGKVMDSQHKDLDRNDSTEDHLCMSY